MFFSSVKKLLFKKPEHNEYTDSLFNLFLIHLVRLSGVAYGATLHQAREALDNLKKANANYFFISLPFESQISTVKEQLYRAREHIAKEASVFASIEVGEIEKMAQTAHMNNMLGTSSDFVLISKVNLLEYIAILEVCNELNIDLFEGDSGR
jgi:ATP/ADP translocase